MSIAETRSYDVVVLGGGPAGTSAALFCARDGLQVSIVDPLGIGGALINVENLPDYPGFLNGVAGWDLASSLGEQALLAGVELVLGRAETPVPSNDGWLVPVPDSGQRLAARAVVVATGCRPRALPGDDRQRSLQGHGVSYCAACDGPLFRGQRVVVVGGGDVAMAEAISLVPLVEHVTIVFPETLPSAGKAWLDQVLGLANVTVLGGHTVRGLRAVGGAVEGVEGLTSDGSPFFLAASGVFGALDPLPNSEILGPSIELAADGRIPTDPKFAVLRAPVGLFAVGDVRAGSAQRAVVAAGEGAAAGLAVAAFLGPHTGSHAGSLGRGVSRPSILGPITT